MSARSLKVHECEQPRGRPPLSMCQKPRLRVYKPPFQLFHTSLPTLTPSISFYQNSNQAGIRALFSLLDVSTLPLNPVMIVVGSQCKVIRNRWVHGATSTVRSALKILSVAPNVQMGYLKPIHIRRMKCCVGTSPLSLRYINHPSTLILYSSSFKLSAVLLFRKEIRGTHMSVVPASEVFG
jgi:hypothetical protein